MSRRLLLTLVPVLLAASATLASPAPVLGADGITETGVTTYELRPDKGLIHVTISLSLKNTKKNESKPCKGYYVCTTRYYWNTTSITIETAATNVVMTSNAGRVMDEEVDSNRSYRALKLTFPNVYYGQTRVVTVTYDLPAAPRSNSYFRAGRAYANLCAYGQGYDRGSLNVVVPKGFDEVDYYAGESLNETKVTSATKTLSSGSVGRPSDFWTCLEAVDDAALVNATVVAGGTTFEIRSWPEDGQWSKDVSADVSGDVARLQDMIGLPMPKASITIEEAANLQLGDYAGVYNPTDHRATISEEADPATVAHELSHIWFNKELLTDRWMIEGMAGYAEKTAGPGRFAACKKPGAYPVSGSNPDLKEWRLLGPDSTAEDERVVAWQYGAACYLVATLADEAGPARFKEIIGAISRNEIAYAAAGQAGTSAATSSPPATARFLLDLIDERGLVPAGSADLDRAQNLFVAYGILSSSEVAGRSDARAAYHALEGRTGGWTLPPVIRQPMASWDFEAARSAMQTAERVLGLRDELARVNPPIALAGTDVQERFESATSAADLESIVTLLEQERAAAAKVDEARRAYGASRSLTQSVGLIGSDLRAPLDRATAALVALRPEEAVGAANEVIDGLAKASDTGTQRIAIAGVSSLTALLLLLVLIVLLVQRRSRRRELASAAAAAAFYAQGGYVQAGGTPWAATGYQGYGQGFAQPVYPPGYPAPQSPPAYPAALYPAGYDATAPAWPQAAAWPAPPGGQPEPPGPDDPTRVWPQAAPPPAGA